MCPQSTKHASKGSTLALNIRAESLHTIILLIYILETVFCTGLSLPVTQQEGIGIHQQIFACYLWLLINPGLVHASP